MADPAIIETKRLRLVPFSPARHLTETYVGWLNDTDVVRYSEQRHKAHSLDSCLAFVSQFDISPSFLWAIETKSDSQHIGNIHAEIETTNGIADVAILIGDRSAWGQGYGMEAWNGVLAQLKQEGDVRKIVAGCMASNKAMRAIMDKSGMIMDGTRKAHYVLDGKPEDLVFSALFND